MRYAKWGLLSVALITGFYLGYTSYHKIKRMNAYAMMVQHLPPFSFYSLNGKNFTSASVPNGYAGIVIGHFHPECEHCQYMAEQINSCPSRCKHTLFIMVTSADSVTAAAFVKTYHWAGKENIQVVLDKSNVFYKNFGTGLVPCFFVYNADGSLKKKIPGETSIDHLLD